MEQRGELHRLLEAGGKLDWMLDSPPRCVCTTAQVLPAFVSLLAKP